jgi:hypothetical protein
VSRDYFIINNGRTVYAQGHYDEDTAGELAQKWAKRNPGRTYRVMHQVAAYQVPRPTKP